MTSISVDARRDAPSEVAADIAATIAEQTIPRLFLSTVERRPDEVAIRARAGEDWVELTWAEYRDRADRMAGALAALGVGAGDRVAMMMRNRPEFFWSDMGALLRRATPFAIYNSSPPEQVEYLLGHSEARIAIVEDLDFLERVLKVRSSLPELRQIVLIEGEHTEAIAFEELLAGEPVDVEAAAAATEPSDIVQLIYTSGTTGPPKGAMTTHANVCWMMESFLRSLEEGFEGDRLISYLPLAHALERGVSYYMHAREGSVVTTCPDPALIGAYLRDVHPHFIAAVPRVYEKLAEAALGFAETAEQRRQLNADLEIGKRAARASFAGEELDEAELRDLEAARRRSLDPARAHVGMDSLKSAFSGGAPLAIRVHELLLAIGVPLADGYGLTETTHAFTWDPYEYRIGTVGRALPGAELRLADDGEVLCRSGSLFAGYLKDPEKTAEMFDPDGWLRTGDIGELDADGYLRIVDRKKELIITAGGKNISPANIENALKAHPLIGQACAIGDNRRYVTALLVLDPAGVAEWAGERGIEPVDLASLSAHPDLLEELRAAVDEVNSGLARVEQVKRFRVLPREWMPDSEELTPTMKLKRRGVARKYADEIEALYAAEPELPTAAPSSDV